MAQLFKCESCARFREHKVLNKDGICFLVPKKPKYVFKSQHCKVWKDRKTGLDAAKTMKKIGGSSCS